MQKIWTKIDSHCYVLVQGYRWIINALVNVRPSVSWGDAVLVKCYLKKQKTDDLLGKNSLKSTLAPFQGVKAFAAFCTSSFSS